jgi:hypothetical protein
VLKRIFGARADRIARSEQRLEDRYVLSGVLIVACILVFAFAGDGRAGKLIAVVLEGVTLLVILRASQARIQTVRIVGSCVVVAVLGVALSSTADGPVFRTAPIILGVGLAFGAPFVIARRLWRQPTINITTIAGALCIYLLAGLFFALTYWTMSGLDHNTFFAQPHSATGVDYVYFSFVTLTTVGYGDLTALHSLGRMTAILEALFGQLYLVSIVAVLVSNMGRARPAREHQE